MSFLRFMVGICVSLLLSLSLVLSAPGLVGNTIRTTFADCNTVMEKENCIAAEVECTTPSNQKCEILPADKKFSETWRTSAEGMEMLEKVEAQAQKWKAVGDEFWCRDPSAKPNRVKCRQLDKKQRSAAGCGYEWAKKPERKGAVEKRMATPFLLPKTYAKSKDGTKLYVCVQDKDVKTKLTAETYKVDAQVDELIKKLNTAGLSAA